MSNAEIYKKNEDIKRIAWICFLFCCLLSADWFSR